MAAYGTDAAFQAWLDEQGLTLPAGAPTPAVLRARGSGYVDSYEAKLTGNRTGGAAQELAWPRTGASLNCRTAIDADLIPPAVVTAAYRAAWLEGQNPGTLAGPVMEKGKRVKSQRVEGAVSREFFDDGKLVVGGGPSFIDPLIDGLLAGFICQAQGKAFLWALGS